MTILRWRRIWFCRSVWRKTRGFDFLKSCLMMSGNRPLSPPWSSIIRIEMYECFTSLLTTDTLTDTKGGFLSSSLPVDIKCMLGWLMEPHSFSIWLHGQGKIYHFNLSTLTSYLKCSKQMNIKSRRTLKNPNYKNVSPFKINIFGLLPLIFAVEIKMLAA